jgi:hypothetical protein
MSRQQKARTQQPHAVEIGQVYERVLAGASVRTAVARWAPATGSISWRRTPGRRSCSSTAQGAQRGSFCHC